MYGSVPGIVPDIVVGTSMGSVVGGLYASGMDGADLQRAVESMNWDAIFDATPPRNGLTYRQKQQEAEFPVKPTIGVVKGRPRAPEALVPDANLLLQLRRLLGVRAAVPTFDDLPIRFRAVATDIETGNKVVLDRGDLAHIQPGDLLPDTVGKGEAESNLMRRAASNGFMRNKLTVLDGGAGRLPDMDGALALSSMPAEDLRLERIRAARMKGYEGDSCDECGNFTLIRNGTCLKCDTCGATSGCS